jgi:hypothetical protein
MEEEQVAAATEAIASGFPFVDSGGLLQVLATVMFLAGLAFVFFTLKRKNQGFGVHSVRALGVALFLPTLLFAIEAAGLPGEATAALLGTLAGYLFASKTDEKEEP